MDACQMATLPQRHAIQAVGGQPEEIALAQHQLFAAQAEQQATAQHGDQMIAGTAMAAQQAQAIRR